MKFFIRQATIIDPSSSFHLQTIDLRITNGIISEMGDALSPSPDEEQIEFPELMISPSWVDTLADYAEPGEEHRETLCSGSEAAITGGFGHVFLVPNTTPVVDQKTQVSYIVNASKQLPIQLYPLGAISQGTEGKTLAEMYDMHHAGAVAFSDGIHPVQSPGLFSKALQYVKAFKGVVVQIPITKSLSEHGLMHEGVVSTQMGLPGIAAIAEDLIVARDLELLAYTNSRLHIAGISTSTSVERIRAAKKAGLHVTCSVAPYHLYYIDADLDGYNSSLKVNPPLRTASDRAALQEAVLDGTIDCIASFHIPQHWDAKTCEFEYAAWGMAIQELCFQTVISSIPTITAEKLVQIFSLNPRKIFGLADTHIHVGQKADLTLFSFAGNTQINSSTQKSKGVNNPLLNIELKGTVLPNLRSLNTHIWKTK
ncbi:MAG: dihydroorotase [Hydrotalea sp.]|nr:dihydroorotase [Hydrotalea sp.]